MSSHVRKCKLCKRNIKGHKGPYGVSRCANTPERYQDKTFLNIKSLSLTDKENIIQETGRPRNIIYCLTSLASYESSDEDAASTEGFLSPVQSFHKCSSSDSHLHYCDNASESTGALLERSIESTVDIKTAISGYSLIICTCVNIDCSYMCDEAHVHHHHCSGEVKFEEFVIGDKYALKDLSSDLYHSDVEFTSLTLVYNTSSWNENEPGYLRFDVESSGSEVGNVEGKLVLQAREVTEEVHGEKGSMIIWGRIKLSGVLFGENSETDDRLKRLGMTFHMFKLED